MSLSLSQRLDSLKVRIAEVAFWRDRAHVAVEGWTLEGKPIAKGDAWPHRNGTLHFAAKAEAPKDWPLADTRLQLDLGGESLVTLTYGDGKTQTFGLDPYHQEFRIKAKGFSIATDSVARFPFGEQNRDPRLNRARFIWLDVPVHKLHMLLSQVYETITALGEHEVIPHLMTAAERTLNSLDWPSASDPLYCPHRNGGWPAPHLELP
jgi:alpha-mannosidase